MPRLRSRWLAAAVATIGLSGVSTAAAVAGPYEDRANEYITQYGSTGGYWMNRPSDTASGSSTRVNEWRKGVFYSALATYFDGTANAKTVARGRVGSGFTKDSGPTAAGSLDMFAVSALVDLWKRAPLGEFEQDPATPSTAPYFTKVNIRTAIWAQCWHAVDTNPELTANQRVMLWTIALMAESDTAVNTRPTPTTYPANWGTTACPSSVGTGAIYNNLSQVNAATKLGAFMDATVKYGFPEQDSATYGAYYLAPLRLIADKYPGSALAAKANRTFEWIVTNLAGEWHNGDYTATTSRQYFPRDGSAGDPMTLGNYLRVIFGGKVGPVGQGTFWESVAGPAGTIRKPWGAPAVPLALSTWRPSAELTEAATQRDDIFAQRESTRQDSTATSATPLAFGTRYAEKGTAQLATAMVNPVGWEWPQQAQDFTLHLDEPTTNNRTLTIANPKLDRSPWDSDLTSYKPLDNQPGLQFATVGRAAVGVLETGTDLPRKIRAQLGRELYNTGQTFGTNPWHIFTGATHYLAIRSVNQFTADARPLFPTQTPDDGFYFTANNPGGGVGSFVIVDMLEKSVTTPQGFATLLNSASRVQCSGIPLAPACTNATTRPTVEYTAIDGQTIKIGFPDAGGATPQRWINGRLVNTATWPVLENPWAEQRKDSNLLRISAKLPSGQTSTKVTEYESTTASPGWTETTASKTFNTAFPNSGTLDGSGSPATGWVTANWAGAAGSYSQVTPAHAGTHASQVTVGGAGGNAGYSLISTNRVTTTSTQRATVTAWIRTDGVSAGAGEGAFVWARWIKPDGTYVCGEYTSEPVTGNTSDVPGKNVYVARSVTVPAKCDTTAKLAVSLRLKGTGTARFDDVDIALHD